jgi:TPR repeat protein
MPRRVVIIRCLALLLGMSLVGISALKAASFEHSYAIVVGITNYPRGHWVTLPYARGDAEAVAGVLKRQGYQVTELYDEKATRRDILNALSAVTNKLGPHDRIFVFLSLHGTNKRVGGEGYIIPYDGIDYPSYISDAELKDASEQMQTARHQLFILDACYGGLMITRSGGVSPEVPNYIDEVTSRIARQILTAGGADQPVLDSGPNGHSVFANALLEGLAGQADFNKDGYITYAELEAYVIPRASNAYQTPATGVLPGHGGGEYVFVSPLGAARRTSSPDTVPPIVIKKGDTDQMATAKELLKASRFYEALPLLHEAAANGNGEAMYNLGLAYDNGWGVPKDYSKAKEWYEKSAAAGNGHAMGRLGFLYEDGRGVPKDYAEAKEWYEKGAATGAGDAMACIGFLYGKGWGVPQDFAKEKEWYEKSAATGDGIAMYNLGLLYGTGRGVPKDYAEAREWYEKSAAAGNGHAMWALGLLYENGQGVPMDYSKAKEWYEKGAATGDDEAMVSLGFLYAHGWGVPQDFVNAKEWYEKGAAAGNNTAMYNVGLFYEKGWGIPQDLAKAKEWYEKGAAAGNSVAQQHLNDLPR